jgi:hypothetical protein
MTITHLQTTVSRDNFHYLGTARLPELEIFESYSLNTSSLSRHFRKDSADAAFLHHIYAALMPAESLAPHLG